MPSSGFYALYVRAGATAASMDKLVAATRQAVNSASFHEKVKPMQLVAQSSTPGELNQIVQTQAVQWKEVIQSMKLTPQ